MRIGMFFREKDMGREKCARKRVCSVANDLPTRLSSTEHRSFNKGGLPSAKHGGSGRQVSGIPSADAIIDKAPDTSGAPSSLVFALVHAMNAVKYFMLVVQAERASGSN